MTDAQWGDLAAGLAERTAGVREAGAFLLARTREHAHTRVSRFIYFDDLDPTSLNGGIAIKSSVFSMLWGICRAEQLRVIADVHTHPGRFVSQSHIDRENPMVARVGHVAIITPYLAVRPFTPADCGVHEYLGGHRWDASFGRRARRILYVGRWA